MSNIDYTKVARHVNRAGKIFEEVWQLNAQRSENKDTAFRWFAMSYGGQQLCIDELEAKIAELESLIARMDAMAANDGYCECLSDLNLV